MEPRNLKTLNENELESILEDSFKISPLFNKPNTISQLLSQADDPVFKDKILESFYSKVSFGSYRSKSFDDYVYGCLLSFRVKTLEGVEKRRTREFLSSLLQGVPKRIKKDWEDLAIDLMLLMSRYDKMTT